MSGLDLLAVVLGALLCGALGSVVPALISRLPEPEPDPGQGPAPAPPKELYADLAALPGLAWRCALAAALAGALVGLAIGWDWRLLPWLAFTPVAVALGLIDWRTRLLPFKIMAPSYGVVIALTLLAALLSSEWHLLRGAAVGWLVWGVFFLIFWLIPGGMGYGDVRLAGVLGILLGALGFAPLVFGLEVTTVLAALGGVAIAVWRRRWRMRFAYGPFMLIGALLGALLGPAVLQGLGY